MCDWRKRGVNHEEAHIVNAVRLGKVFDLLIKHFFYYSGNERMVVAMKMAFVLFDGMTTTNSSAYDLLAPYCAEVIPARVVCDGNTVTGAGVTASIDLGLYMVEMLTSTEVVLQVQQKLEYPYYKAGNIKDV